MRMYWRKALLLVVAAIVATAVSEEEDTYSVTITTHPRQGPFRTGQTVQFSCSVHPTPPGNLTYQWRNVERIFSGSSSTRSFNRTYYERYLHYCYYYCEVFDNGTMLGSTSRIVEVLGFLYPVVPVVQYLLYGGSILLSVNETNNIYNRYFSISSLSWYHNGTEIISGENERMIIDMNGTRLSITNMEESDAGTYQVKINSTSSSFGRNSESCDLLALPLLELTAGHAPVTFTVLEQHTPTYNPSSIVSTHYISEDTSNMIQLQSTNTSLGMHLDRHRISWLRNGSYISNNNMFNSSGSSLERLSLQVTSNNSADITGDYLGIVWIDYYSWYFFRSFLNMCRGYYNYVDYFLRHLPVTVSYWSIKVYTPPSSVLLSLEKAILRECETTGVECTAVGGGPAEAHHLMLWGHGGQLLASVNGSHLHYQTTPHQYGTYTCSVGNISNFSTLQERVSFQLLLDAEDLRCQQDNNFESVLSKMFGGFCETCDVYPSNIVDIRLNCSASGLVYLSADLVYSSPDGRITANTLTNELLIWLLSQDSPSIPVNGVSVSLNKQCAPQLNNATQSACIQRLVSQATEAADSRQSYTIITVIGGSLGGLAAGVVITTLFITSIICVRKSRGSATQTSKSQATSKNDKQEISMASNHAYETMDAHCEAGEGRGGGKSQEQMYEAMDTRYQVRGTARREALPYESVGVPYQAAGEDDIYEQPAV